MVSKAIGNYLLTLQVQLQKTTDLSKAVGTTRLIFSAEISEMESSVGMQDNKTFARFLSGRNSHLGIFTELLESDE